MDIKKPGAYAKHQWLGELGKPVVAQQVGGYPIFAVSRLYVFKLYFQSVFLLKEEIKCVNLCIRC